MQEGHDLAVVDAKIEGIDRSTTVQRILAWKPQMVGITAMTHEIHEAAAICSAIKSAIPSCSTVVGGAHVTALPGRTLREFDAIDIAVLGEGELTSCELARKLDVDGPHANLSGIPGICYRSPVSYHASDPPDSTISLTSSREPIRDLDSLPFPAWNLFPRDADWPVFAGRGCPYRCAFCQRVLGGALRLRSPQAIIEEFDAMERQLGAKSSWFQDETFGVKKKWTDQFLDLLIRRNQKKGYVWRWKANSRVNIADGAVYKKMAQAGCTMLDFGIESGNSVMLNRIHKDITLDQARRAMRLAKAAGIKTNAFFIIGHPGETLITSLQTIRAAANIRTDDIAVGVMVPYPGTEIWDMAQRGQYGYKLISENWRLYDKYFGNALELKSLSHRQLEFLQALTYVWFYTYNLKFREFARFVTRFSGEAHEMLRRLLSDNPNH